MGFWERTWQERRDEIYRAYGDTWPPDTVHAFSWDDIRCPGACALALPPLEQSREPVRHRREDWLYLSLGLSQPIDKKQFQAEREAGKQYSAFGLEFAFLTPKESPWAIEALYYFMTYMTEGEYINWGDRFPFLFHLREETLAVMTGNPKKDQVTPVGKIRAVLFWPFLFPDWEFVTTTGKFMVMIATGITQQEWDLAKRTTTAHVMLLLQRSGIGQRTIHDRACLLESSRWQNEWTRIEPMDPNDCMAELQSRGFLPATGLSMG